MTSPDSDGDDHDPHHGEHDRAGAADAGEVAEASGASGASGVAEDIEDADPGLARERTGLAWTRSSISFAAIGVAILKFRPVIGVPVLLLSAVIWSIGRMPRSPGLAGAAPRRVLTVAVSVTVVALIVLALAVAGHSKGLHP